MDAYAGGETISEALRQAQVATFGLRTGSKSTNHNLKSTYAIAASVSFIL